MAKRLNATTLVCPQCQRVLKHKDFYLSTNGKHGTYCKECSKKRYRHLRPIITKRWRDKNPEYKRSWVLRSLYNMVQEEYDRLSVAQNGKCAICKGPSEFSKRFHIDHDHVTGKIRGLLCGPCNRGLGAFRDNTKVLSAAAKYLTKPSRRAAPVITAINTKLLSGRKK